MAQIKNGDRKKMERRLRTMAEVAAIFQPNFNPLESYWHFCEYQINNWESIIALAETMDGAAWLQEAAILHDRVNSVPSAYFHHSLPGDLMSEYVSDLSIFNDTWGKILEDENE